MKAMNLLLLAAGAYLLYTWKGGGVPSQGFQVCKYPDGTTIQVPAGSACPVDFVHGGQSLPCGISPYAPC